jgi:hypothetical protein
MRRNWPRILPSLPAAQYDEHSFASDADTIVPWISLQDASGNYVVTRMDISVEDEHGCVFRRSGSSGCTIGKMQLDCTQLDAYPRRQKQFKMRISRGTNVVTFMVQNPKIIQPVEWNPSPLPASVKVGDLKTTIVGLKSGNSDYYGACFIPKREIYEKNRVTTEWSVYNMRVHDATGNSGYDFLCPREPAVKLSLDLRKNENAAFSANELWALPAMPLPDPGKFIVLNGSRKFNGATIRLESLAGAGNVTYSNGAPVSSVILDAGFSGRGLSGSGTGRYLATSKSVDWVFATTVTGLKSDQNILIFCIDDKGKKTVSDGGSTTVWDLRLLTLPVDQAAKTVQINIVVQTLVRMEFFLKPPVAL